jgi:hypothetical protein
MTDRWDIPDLEPFERVGWEEQQREWPRDEADLQYVREGIALDVKRYGHVAAWREQVYFDVAAEDAETRSKDETEEDEE